MFNRSRNRTTTHSTAYTGVNQSTVSNSQQPDSNALAAALSIGKALQQNNDGSKPGTSMGRTNSFPVQRSPSMQSRPSNGSLLKRNSILRKTSNHSVSEFGDFSSNSVASGNGSRRKGSDSSKKLVYDIDDTMNDSYFDEVTDETQEYYNNHAHMKDLKLSHKPQPQSYRTGSLRSKSSGNRVASDGGEVKMVKKYIPTPNGIKVVEVPESNIAREFARSNSIRSGRNISRSGSMNSISAKGASRLSSLVSNGPKPGPAKRVPSRLSSLVSSPNMSPMLEDVELEASLGKEDDFKEQTLRYKNLQRQIEHEKKMSKELELKTLEYEKLKRLRMENEEKFLALRREADEYESKSKENSPEVDKNVDFNPIAKDISEEQETQPEIEKPRLTSLDQSSNRSSFYDDEEEEEEDGEEYSKENNLTDENDENNKNEVTEEVNSDEFAANSTIDASSVVVDELEKKEIEEEVTNEYLSSDEALKVQEEGHESGPSEEKNLTLLGTGSNVELGIISSYNHSLSNESLKGDNMIHPSSDLESENDEKNSDDEGTNLANQLRPTFDAVPEIIDNETEENISTLEVPNTILMKSSNSSINSANSTENSSIKNKPMKSAMKNSRSFYNSSNSAKADNPAHQAYLSLTTAENTRLNSKLSSGQLDPSVQVIAPPTVAQNVAPANKQKRMSSSLRNSAPINPSGLMHRTLRPQSGQFSQEQVNHNGMSNKTLRNKTYVQPIGMHPTLQPNYESPSKIRAAELYAKANARSSSVFASISRRSSYVREENQENQETTQPTQPTQPKVRHTPSTPSNAIRTSLRNIPSQHIQHSHLQSQTQIQNNYRPNDSTGSVPSRFDENFNNSHKKFTSRIVDSDDEVSNYNSSFGTSSQKDIPSLRTSHSKQNNKSDGKTNNQKEKKKFGKLRKLFGRNA